MIFGGETVDVVCAAMFAVGSMADCGSGEGGSDVKAGSGMKD